jgi:peptide/nickel transport system substrate-binding protein
MSGFQPATAAVAVGIMISFASPTSAENVLRWASAGGAATFDPHSFDETPTRAQYQQVYERLLDLDSSLEMTPQLAISWKLVDPVTWEFTLRQGVRFHDGTPLSADDVVFSLERARTKPSQLGVYLTGVSDIRAVDTDTVHVITRDTAPLVPENLTLISIMSKAWAEAHGAARAADFNMGEETYASRHANGTGPFILEEFQPGGPAAMRRNPNWWGYERYPANVDRIEYTPIPDAERRLAALLEGKIDLLTDPPFEALDRIRATPGWRLEQAGELRTVFLGLDQAVPELRSSDVRGVNPFRDKRVREAMYRSIDIEAIRRDVMKGLSVPAGMLVAPGVTGFSEELNRRLAYDPDLAKASLADAGYPDGFRIRLDCPNNRYVNDEAICRAVTKQLGAIGIEATLDVQPKEIHFRKILSRETDLWMQSWAEFDSQEVFLTFFHSRGSPWNAAGYANPRVDELIDKIDRTIITYARDAMIEEVWTIVLDDMAYIPLHHQIIVWAMRDELDLPVYPFNSPKFREARLK